MPAIASPSSHIGLGGGVNANKLNLSFHFNKVYRRQIGVP